MNTYEIITARIIDLLEKGVVPWQKPWKGKNYLPRNLISKKPYQGMNIFLLHSLEYEMPFWLTFKQVKSLGGKVKAQERSAPVVFWKVMEPDKDDPDQKKRFVLRYYAVFNVSQCEGLEKHIPEIPLEKNEVTPIEAAQKIVEGMPQKPTIKFGMRGGYYSSFRDEVGMPNPERFKNMEGFYSVIFHELTHSTGHPSRLNRRDISEITEFGGHSYSREELVAEMGSAFLCGECGIVDKVINNSASYLAHWIERLKNDSKLLIQASSQAQKAADFILDRKKEEACQSQE